MLGGILSLVGSLVSNVVVAAIFGANADMDAYITSMVIPSYFQLVFYSSLSFVLVPAFIEAQARKEEDDAWALVGTFFWLITAILVSISVIGSLFSARIISMSAPGFPEEKAELASQMLSVLMFTVPFVGLGTLTVGIQNARNRFFWPSVAPAFGALGNVVTLLVFYPLIGGIALCWGYFTSIVIQAGFTILPILLHGWTKVYPVTDRRVLSNLKLMLPLIFFGMLNSFSPIAERYYSSGLPDGQIAYMGYVNKLAAIFVLLLATGIASSIFPSMARAYAQGGIEALSEKNSFGLRLSFAVALPGILIASAISVPLISVFFERGAFEHADTIGVSLIVFPFFLNDVFFRMVGNILQRSFYVLKDATTQLSVSTFFLILYIATAGFFVTRWGYVGLVWATTMRRGLVILVVWILLSRKFPRIHQWHILLYFLKYACAALVAYLSGRSIVLALASVPAFFQLAASGLTSSILYLVILYFIDNEILKAVLDLGGLRLIIEKLQNGGKKPFLKGI
jgi:putative peptidoglycan lipid II flippase